MHVTHALLGEILFIMTATRNGIVRNEDALVPNKTVQSTVTVGLLTRGSKHAQPETDYVYDNPLGGIGYFISHWLTTVNISCMQFK